MMNDDFPIHRAVPIREILDIVAGAVRNAMLDPGPCPAIIKNPLHLVNLVRNGETRRRANSAAYGIPVPRFCIFSVTWKCSLSCAGCYAKCYSSMGSLDNHEIRRIIREASELGTFIFLIAGGEPLEVPGLLPVLSAERQALFLVFTNGMTITDEHLGQFACSSNILPIISIEGDGTMNDRRRGTGTADQIREGMSRLRAAGVGFGFSTMVTHQNMRHVTARDWMEKMWRRGARFGFLVDYIPLEHGLEPEMVLTDGDRAFKDNAVAERKREARPFVVNFPPDEYRESGCLSGGNGFIHINADGFVEPCPFCHYAADNVKEKPLRTILKSPFLSSIRKTFGAVTGFPGTCLLFKEADLVERIAASTGAARTDAGRPDLSGVKQTKGFNR